ncbi:replication initiator [Streptomyces rubrogriseus]|uniref:replication initiator n=1 Tax=Streptomyces rubrogriseus TaxID=194673 RepID=UPI0036804BC3
MARTSPPPSAPVRVSSSPSPPPPSDPSTAGETGRPRRDGGTCEHGRPHGCHTVHASTDPLVGQPVCPDCYDYTGHVLWHAHKLWDRFVIDVRRRLASSAGIVQSRFARHARLSFARIAEYQKGATVHVHAVIRLDGPDGPTDDPPPWGTPDRLTRAVYAFAQRVTVRTSCSPAVGELDLSWGTQTDVRVLRADGDGPDDDAVAAYVAKYVTKGSNETGAGTDHKVTTWDDIDTAPVSRHVRTLMHTCWRLGGLPAYVPLRLHTWTLTLGYQGHIVTKSRAYSTTYARTTRRRRPPPRPHRHFRRDHGCALALHRLRPHPRRRPHCRWRRYGPGGEPGGST